MTNGFMQYPPGATPLEPDEMEGLKFSHVTARGQLDHLEQANIGDRRDAYLKALRTADGGNYELLMVFVRRN